MKLSELNENVFKKALYKAFGKIPAEDIVDGAEFSLDGQGGDSDELILGTRRVRIVDERDNMARYVYVYPDGEVYDPDELQKLDISSLYDGDPVLAARLKARAAKVKARVKRDFKSNIARFLNDCGAKKIK